MCCASPEELTPWFLGDLSAMLYGLHDNSYRSRAVCTKVLIATALISTVTAVIAPSSTICKPFNVLRMFERNTFAGVVKCVANVESVGICLQN